MRAGWRPFHLLGGGQLTFLVSGQPPAALLLVCALSDHQEPVFCWSSYFPSLLLALFTEPASTSMAMRLATHHRSSTTFDHKAVRQASPSLIHFTLSVAPHQGEFPATARAGDGRKAAIGLEWPNRWLCVLNNWRDSWYNGYRGGCSPESDDPGRIEGLAIPSGQLRTVVG